MLGEHRANGTVLQTNSTGLGTIAAHYSHATTHDEISVFGDYTSEKFRAGFSAIVAGRNTERLTMLQTVPSDAIGAAAFWRHGESRWQFLAGGDTRSLASHRTAH